MAGIPEMPNAPFAYEKQWLIDKFLIPLNDQQVVAINSAVSWYKGYKARSHRRQTFCLAGYAGTGKTSIAKVISELCCTMEWTAFIAPTGKAASRLRFKGCPQAQTLHQFVYNVRGENEDGEPIFIAKGDLNDRPRLIVLDEASMVGGYDAEKLLSHGIPVLALYDPGQLDPVKAAIYFTEQMADVLLDQIERNAGAIVRGSMFVRQGKRLPCREYEDCLIHDGNISDADLLTFLGDDGVILASYNNTRRAMNNRARRILGYEGNLPMPGEKVVCTSNQHGYNIMNGEQGIVIGFEDLPESDEHDDDPDGLLILNFRSLTDGKIRKAKFNPLSFSDDFETRESAQKSKGGFDFGYALTVHKSQGSEWMRVFIVEELLRGVSYAKMMYTAITRAIKFLRIQRFR